MSTKYQQHMFLLITFNFHFNEANGASHVALMVEIVHGFVIKTLLPTSLRTAFVEGTYCQEGDFNNTLRQTNFVILSTCLTFHKFNINHL